MNVWTVTIREGKSKKLRRNITNCCGNIEDAITEALKYATDKLLYKNPEAIKVNLMEVDVVKV